MPLPQISTPKYEIELPSTGELVEYRPFLVKEEKLLILALESQDNKQITNSIKDVIKNCILTKGIKVDKLPTFDIEYLFLNIRGKSVGEELEVSIVCPDDEETVVPVKIYIDEITVKKNDEHTKIIKVDDKISIEMKYPSLDHFIQSNFDFNSKSTVEQSFDLIASCIDQIYTEDQSWAASDTTKKELIGFLEQMNATQFKEVEKFFDTMPKLYHEVEIENPNTKVKHVVPLEGLSDFFG
jgi:hypothetical protein